MLAKVISGEDDDDDHGDCGAINQSFFGGYDSLGLLVAVWTVQSAIKLQFFYRK